jgi:flagellar biosynthesis protein
LKKAVAIKYPEGAEIPFITAKGRGELADKIVEIAEKNNVKIENDALLVDVLDVQKIGDAIPEEAWQAVAKILAFVLEIKK